MSNSKKELENKIKDVKKRIATTKDVNRKFLLKFRLELLEQQLNHLILKDFFNR